MSVVVFPEFGLADDHGSLYNNSVLIKTVLGTEA